MNDARSSRGVRLATESLGGMQGGSFRGAAAG